jgi:hypothetical protein
MERSEMAAWHVHFSIIPRRALAAARAAKQLPPADAAWWAADVLPAGNERKLAAVASLESPASATRQSWGPEDGNRVDVWSVDGRATMVAARVDVRRLDARFSAMLLQFVRTANAVLVRSDGLIVEPVVGAFGAALRSSEAWRFANDPASHFASYVDPPTDDDARE